MSVPFITHLLVVHYLHIQTSTLFDVYQQYR